MCFPDFRLSGAPRASDLSAPETAPRSPPTAPMAMSVATPTAHAAARHIPVAAARSPSPRRAPPRSRPSAARSSRPDRRASRCPRVARTTASSPRDGTTSRGGRAPSSPTEPAAPDGGLRSIVLKVDGEIGQGVRQARAVLPASRRRRRQARVHRHRLPAGRGREHVRAPRQAIGRHRGGDLRHDRGRRRPEPPPVGPGFDMDVRRPRMRIPKFSADLRHRRASRRSRAHRERRPRRQERHALLRHRVPDVHRVHGRVQGLGGARRRRVRRARGGPSPTRYVHDALKFATRRTSTAARRARCSWVRRR